MFRLNEHWLMAMKHAKGIQYLTSFVLATDQWGSAIIIPIL